MTIFKLYGKRMKITIILKFAKLNLKHMKRCTFWNFGNAHIKNFDILDFTEN